MILVSFSSAEDTLFDDVKRYGTFKSQGAENLPFRFFWDTQYSCTQLKQITPTSSLNRTPESRHPLEIHYMCTLNG